MEFKEIFHKLKDNGHGYNKIREFRMSYPIPFWLVHKLTRKFECPKSKFWGDAGKSTLTVVALSQESLIRANNELGSLEFPSNANYAKQGLNP